MSDETIYAGFIYSPEFVRSRLAALQESVKRIKSEAEWGLNRSGGHRTRCNARTALTIILEILADPKGKG